MRMVRLFLLFFMLAHWVGCFWYLLLDDDVFPGDKDDFIYKYIFALFHGLLILVGEGIDSAKSSEKIFIVLMMMVG